MTTSRPTCHLCCQPTIGPVRNHVGGAFWLCTTCKGSNGANLTWNLRDGRCNNDPSVVAPASVRRSRVTSLRETTFAQAFVAGHERKTIEEFLDTFGVPETRRLLGLAA